MGRWICCLNLMGNDLKLLFSVPHHPPPPVAGPVNSAEAPVDRIHLSYQLKVKFNVQQPY